MRGSAYKKKFKNSAVDLKQEPLKSGHCLNPSSSGNMKKQIVNALLYKQIREAADLLFNQITAECNQRIRAIKKSTAEALQSIAGLKQTLNSFFISGNFNMRGLLELKNYSNKASTFYKGQCETFNSCVDKAALEVGSLLEGPGFNSQNFEQVKINQKPCTWGIAHDGGVKILPPWIISQIEIGILAGKSEIEILKKTQVVSIAYVRAMKYCGILNGKHLPAQDLVKLNT
jgi:hypothetical protein